jgi:hypothetical protein
VSGERRYDVEHRRGAGLLADAEVVRNLSVHELYRRFDCEALVAARDRVAGLSRGRHTRVDLGHLEALVIRRR